MKKFFINLTFGLFAGLLLTSCAKDAEVMTGTINGYVSDYTNANTPIAGVTVTINSKGLTKTTGSDGRFEFMNLEPGTYSLSFTANNYQPTTKQVTVYAGQIATCDAQLEKARALIDISPVNLTFGKSVDQASFTITNNGNNQFTYSISNYPDYVEVSPAAGTVAAKGQQVVSVRIINRSAINEQKNGQLIVNVGNDSYTVSFSIEAYHGETVNVDVSPQTLTFDRNTEQLTFAITNNSSRSVDFNISNNLDILTITPESGTIAANAKNTITVGVTDRKSVTENRTGQITIDIEGNTFVVAVGVDKYEEGGNPDNGNGEIVVTNGLYAYFTFEGNTNDLTDTGLSATAIDVSYTDSYNGSQALSIPGKATSFLTIPDGLVDQQKMSISFWAKDLQDGHVFHAKCYWRSEANTNTVFMLAVENGRLKFVAQNYDILYRWDEYPSFIHNSLDGWHMITLVSDFFETEYGMVTTRLYVDGVYTDVVSEYGNHGASDEPSYNNSTKFVLGGDMLSQTGGWNPPMINATKIIIDNLRVYKYRTLSADEVKEIYNSEKK